MDRRIVMATQSSGAMLAWYYASIEQITLVGATSLVRQWRDRASGGSNLTADLLENPTWEASGGWDGSHPSVRFSGGATHELSATKGQLANLRGAFGILATFQNQDTANNTTLFAWHPAAGGQWVAVTTTPSAGNAFLRVERFDGANLVGATGSINLGTGHRRIAVSFDGTRVSTWVDAVQDLNGSSLAGVGAILSDTWTIGWGDLPFSCNARFVEVQVFRTTLSARDVAGYQAASLNNWGA